MSTDRSNPSSGNATLDPDEQACFERLANTDDEDVKKIAETVLQSSESNEEAKS